VTARAPRARTARASARPRAPRGGAAPADGGFTPGPGLPMGSSARTHPPIGLGLWGLGRWTREDERATRAVAEHAAEVGVPWFDTAEVYGAGRSERLLGDLLARWPAGHPRPFVSTKLSWEHLRPSQVRPALLGSRQRLGVASVDLYLVHAPDAHVPIADTMGALDALEKEGLVAALGVSNFSLEELEAASSALGEGRIAANQVRFNLLERDEADPILEYCRRHRIVVEAYTPTARGLLAGRFLEGRGPPKGDPRSGHGIFRSDQFPEYQARARRLDELARAEGVPLLAIALHALARAGAAPVVGASRPEQVDAMIAAWSARPSDATLDRAEAIAREGTG
jgi:aryl-alcohol dehydrogenase-like predicted oxidoreductase